MTHGVTITYRGQRYYQPGEKDGYRIFIEASDGINMSPKIFAHRNLPIKPGAAEMEGHFDHVCSSVDYHEYPEDAPRLNETPPWYRRSTADIVPRTKDEAERGITAILQDVDMLVRSLDLQDELGDPTVVVIGATEV